ncbi:MAG: RNA polymerase sigma factor [Rubrobacteraceae bacterium]
MRTTNSHHAQPGDAQLVRAARRGDVASLGVLLESYRASLYGRALRLSGHGPQAQDAVQETFLIALRKLDLLREPEAVGGWLHAILRNVCLMRMREDRGDILFDEMPRRLEHSFESSVEEAIDRLAMREWVWTALGQLPEPLRVTAMLRYFGSYASYEEISAILGVPVGTVKSRLNAAKIKLAEALLETAGLAHDEARRITESQQRFFAEAFDLGNRKRDHEMYASIFSDDLEMFFGDGNVLRGIGFFVQGIEEDFQAGVKMHPTNVIAGKDVTVVEADFENPRDDPFHCPPAISIVCFYHEGRVRQLRQYHAQRLKESGNEYR